MSNLDFEKYIQASQTLHGQAEYPFALFSADGALAWKNAYSEQNGFFNVGHMEDLLSNKQKLELCDALKEKKVYICAVGEKSAFSSLEFMPVCDGDVLVATSVRMLGADNSQALLVDKESVSAVPRFLTLIREPMFNLFSIFSLIEKKLEINEMYDDCIFIKKAQKNCCKMLKEATNLSEFYNSVSGLSPIGSECIDFDAYLKNFVRSASFMFDNLQSKKIRITYDGCNEVVPVKISEDDINIVILNVILNACSAHSGVDEQIEIDVSLKKTSKNASVTIKDNGFGIPKSEISSVFTAFSESDGTSPKMGIGLNVVQVILKKYGANCIVMSDEGNGAIVSLNFPLADKETLGLRTSFSPYVSDKLSLLNIYLAEIFDTNP